MTIRDRTAPDDVVRRLAAEADALDHAVYDAVASTPTPTLDVPARWLSKAANYSVLSILIAGVLGTVGGHGGRRAAVRAKEKGIYGRKLRLTSERDDQGGMGRQEVQGAHIAGSGAPEKEYRRVVLCGPTPHASDKRRAASTVPSIDSLQGPASLADGDDVHDHGVVDGVLERLAHVYLHEWDLLVDPQPTRHQ